jgi:hypothetical protein
MQSPFTWAPDVAVQPPANSGRVQCSRVPACGSLRHTTQQQKAITTVLPQSQPTRFKRSQTLTPVLRSTSTGTTAGSCSVQTTSKAKVMEVGPVKHLLLCARCSRVTVTAYPLWHIGQRVTDSIGSNHTHVEGWGARSGLRVHIPAASQPHNK